jgi:putative ABC transport system permease protein
VAPGARPLLSAPWLRAPLIGLRQRAVAVPVALAAGVLALAASSGPLFLSSVASAGLARTAARDCPEAPYAGVVLPPQVSSDPRRSSDPGEPAGNSPDQAPGDLAQLARTDAQVQAALGEVRLAPAFRVLIASVPAVLRPGREGAREQSVTLLARPDLDRHVEVVAGDPGRPGLWMSDLAAERAGVRVGDTVDVVGERAPVVVLYRDLVGSGYGGDLRRDWCTWGQLIRVTLDHRPPPLLLADEATLLRLQRRGAPAQVAAERRAGRPGVNVVSASWYSPLDVERLPLAGARTARDRAAGLETAVRARDLDRGLVAGVRTGTLAEAVAGAERAATAVRGPVLPVTLAGTLVALLLVAAAGGHWVERRRGEAALLVARGAGPGALGLKAALETALPAVAGAVAGCVAARALVGRLGPSPLLEPGALRDALLVAGAATVAGLVLLGAVAGRRTATVERAAAGPGRWEWLPWEAVPAVLAIVAYRRVAATGAVRADELGLTDISPMLLAFPLLALAAGLGVAVRLAGPPLRAARRLAARLRPAAYLGLSRLTAAARVSLALVALVAVPVGVLVYASTVVRTAEVTTAAKAGLYVGADVAVVTYQPPGAAPDTGGAGTPVSVVLDGRTAVGETAVLGIDPDTFARFAFADRHVLGDSVARLAERVRSTGGGRVPAVLAGCVDCPRVDSVELRSSELAVDVVARPRYFPGLRLLRGPTLVVDRGALAGTDRYTQWQEEVWTTADRQDQVVGALLRSGTRMDRVKSPDRFLDVAELTPLAWSFGYLRALAALTGLIALAALVLHVAARERQRSVSHVLARRMGLRRRTHLLSLAHELGWLAGAGWLAGVALGWAAALLVARFLDFDPAFPPAAAAVAPVGLVAATAGAAAAFVAVGVAVAQRSADRTRPAEVLRLGG